LWLHLPLVNRRPQPWREVTRETTNWKVIHAVTSWHAVSSDFFSYTWAVTTFFSPWSWYNRRSTRFHSAAWPVALLCSICSCKEPRSPSPSRRRSQNCPRFHIYIAALSTVLFTTT
jgi:hypothetical protein